MQYQYHTYLHKFGRRKLDSADNKVNKMTNEKSVFVDIDREFLEKNKEKMKEEAEKQYGTGTDSKTRLVYAISDAQADNVNTRIDEIDADSNTITLVADTELGSFWITAEMNVDQLIDLIEVATKKLNKAKTLLETIK